MTNINTEAVTITEAELADIVGGTALDAPLELDRPELQDAKLAAGDAWH